MSESGLFGSTRIAAAITGYADLTLPPADVEAVLRAHMRAAPHHFRGIRQIPTAQQHDLYSEPRFREGFAVLARLGLLFEQWCPDVTLIPSVARLARAFPHVTIVVNHCGGSYSARHLPLGSPAFGAWRRDLADLASCPNVVCKLGGADRKSVV